MTWREPSCQDPGAGRVGGPLGPHSGARCITFLVSLLCGLSPTAPLEDQNSNLQVCAGGTLHHTGLGKVQGKRGPKCLQQILVMGNRMAATSSAEECLHVKQLGGRMSCLVTPPF